MILIQVVVMLKKINKMLIAMILISMIMIAGCSSSSDSEQDTNQPPNQETGQADNQIPDQEEDETSNLGENEMTDKDDTPKEEDHSLPTTCDQTFSEMPKPSADDPYPTREIFPDTDTKISVHDESVKDPTLQAFITKLKKAVFMRDAETFLNMVDEDISYSFGTDDGKKGFIQQWKLDEDVKQSEIWRELERILPWGGTFAKSDKKLYVIPYMFDQFPMEYQHAIIGERVNVREKPNIKSKVIEQLCYDYIQVTKLNMKETYTIDGIEYSWTEIITPSGNTGYVVRKYVYDVYDYRMGIKELDGAWKITFFIAGD